MLSSKQPFVSEVVQFIKNKNKITWWSRMTDERLNSMAIQEIESDIIKNIKFDDDVIEEQLVNLKLVKKFYYNNNMNKKKMYNIKYVNKYLIKMCFLLPSFVLYFLIL